MYHPIIAKASSIKWSFVEIFPFSEESLFDLYIYHYSRNIGPLVVYVEAVYTYM